MTEPVNITVPWSMLEAAELGLISAILIPRSSHLSAGRLLYLNTPRAKRNGDTWEEIQPRVLSHHIVGISRKFICFFNDADPFDTYALLSDEVLFPSQYETLVKTLGYNSLRAWCAFEYTQKNHRYRYIKLEKVEG